jgi:hypothetical protein
MWNNLKDYKVDNCVLNYYNSCTYKDAVQYVYLHPDAYAVSYIFIRSQSRKFITVFCAVYMNHSAFINSKCILSDL